MRRLTLSICVFLILCLVPLTVLAAEAHGDEGWGWIETIGRWINLTILFGAIYYFTREPIRKFLSGRKDSIQDEIVEARRARKEAEEKLAAMEERMKNLNEELAEIRRQGEMEAEREAERVRQQTEEESRRIVESISRQIEGASRSARQELRAYAARLSVDLAEERIRGQMDDRSRRQLVDRFFVSLPDEIGGGKK